MRQRIQTSPGGFTIVEMLVVVAIFSIATLIATNIFVIINRSSQRVAAAQKVQGDLRFALEAITREVRFGTVDYECYDSSATLGNAPCDLSPTLPDLLSTTGKTALLALRDANGNRIRYEVINDTNGIPKLQVCYIDVTTEELTKCNAASSWQIVTSEDVRITNGDFYVYPFTDPFRLRSPIPPTGTSPYDYDQQPVVTIVLKTRQVSNVVSPENISAQTTAVSRYYVR
ncbi:MAG: type II secretion system protein [bacterium]